MLYFHLSKSEPPYFQKHTADIFRVDNVCPQTQYNISTNFSKCFVFHLFDTFLANKLKDLIMLKFA